eukprot:8434930-Karenia_brevis.AAC.1
MHYRWIPSEWNPSDGPSRNLPVASGLKPLVARQSYVAKKSAFDGSQPWSEQQQQRLIGLNSSEPAYISSCGEIWQQEGSLEGGFDSEEEASGAFLEEEK